MSFRSIFNSCILVFVIVLLCGYNAAFGQDPDSVEKAEAILNKAVATLGGERYINVKTQISRGKFSLIRDGAIISFQNFHDVIVYPDKERTEFKGGKARTVQTNTGDTGWLFDGDTDTVKEQTEQQVGNFKRGLRVSLDNLLRRHWRGSAKLEYVGRRPATLGKRNDVIKLIYDDGTVVEFEFSAEEGIPQKAIFKRTNDEGEEITEEDRYAQFVETTGIKAPYIIDRFTNGTHTSRINYESVEYNKAVIDSIFAKPASAKDAKKGLIL